MHVTAAKTLGVNMLCLEREVANDGAVEAGKQPALE